MGASTLSTVMTDAPEPAPERPRGQAVVIAGASAGGVEALVHLVRSLPADFPHAMLIVLHVSPSGTSVLPAILARACPLPVCAPADGEELSPGHVYVAPPDSHLVVEDSHLRLSQAPRENGHRPAIDPTMRTAANAYGGATIGIVLSGSRDDGTAGLIAIKASRRNRHRAGPRRGAVPRDAPERHSPCRARRGPADRGDGALDPRAQPSDESGTHEQPIAHESHPSHQPRQPHRFDRHRIWRSSTPRTTRRGRRRAKARATRARTAAACSSSATRASSSASSAASGTSSRSRASRAPRPMRSRTRCGPRSAPSRTAPLCSGASPSAAGTDDELRSAVAFERQADDAFERARTIRETIQNSSDDRAIAAES